MKGELETAVQEAELALINAIRDLDDAGDILEACEHICGEDHPATNNLRDVMQRLKLLTGKRAYRKKST